MYNQIKRAIKPVLAESDYKKTKAVLKKVLAEKLDNKACLAKFAEAYKQVKKLADELADVVNSCEDKDFAGRLEDVRRGLSMFEREYRNLKKL